MFFIGAVIAIAVVFKLGLGLVKTAEAEPEAPFAASHLPVAVATTPAKPIEAAPAVEVPQVEPSDPTATAPKPAFPKRKPRTHGKR